MMNTISPTRTYVAMVHKRGQEEYKGFCFKLFGLPKEYENNSKEATRYFLDKISPFEPVVTCLTLEEYTDILVPRTETMNIGNAEVKNLHFDWTPNSEFVECRAEIILDDMEAVVDVIMSRTQMELLLIDNPGSNLALLAIGSALLNYGQREWEMVGDIVYGYGHRDIKDGLFKDAIAWVEHIPDGNWHWWLKDYQASQGYEDTKELAMQRALEELKKGN